MSPEKMMNDTHNYFRIRHQNWPISDKLQIFFMGGGQQILTVKKIKQKDFD